MIKQIVYVLMDGNGEKACALDRFASVEEIDEGLKIVIKGGRQKGIITDPTMIKIVREYCEITPKKVSGRNALLRWLQVDENIEEKTEESK